MAGWHKVSVIGAGKVPKKVLCDGISNVCSVPFSPICLTVQGKNDVTFYVEKAVEATALKECHKMTIKVNIDNRMCEDDIPKEYKLNIKVVSSKAPETIINSKGMYQQISKQRPTE